MRKTKIIATLGPASSSDAAIRELIDAGVDVFRFNFSHGTHEGHAEMIARVRRASKESGRMVGLLQDLSGPKIRTGLLRGHSPLPLSTGDSLTIAVGDFEGESGRVSTTFDLPRVVHAGDCLLLDDGRIQLRVDKVSPGEVQRSEEHTSELQSLRHLVCRLLLEKKKKNTNSKKKTKKKKTLINKQRK